MQVWLACVAPCLRPGESLLARSTQARTQLQSDMRLHAFYADIVSNIIAARNFGHRPGLLPSPQTPACSGNLSATPFSERFVCLCRAVIPEQVFVTRWPLHNNEAVALLQAQKLVAAAAATTSATLGWAVTQSTLGAQSALLGERAAQPQQSSTDLGISVQVSIEHRADAATSASASSRLNKQCDQHSLQHSEGAAACIALLAALLRQVGAARLLFILLLCVQPGLLLFLKCLGVELVAPLHALGTSHRCSQDLSRRRLEDAAERDCRCKAQPRRVALSMALLAATRASCPL